MKITPLKATYVTSKDETTIWFNEIKGRKKKECFVTFKGRYFDKVKPTMDNVIKKIQELRL